MSAPRTADRHLEVIPSQAQRSQLESIDPRSTGTAPKYSDQRHELASTNAHAPKPVHALAPRRARAARHPNLTETHFSVSLPTLRREWFRPAGLIRSSAGSHRDTPGCRRITPGSVHPVPSHRLEVVPPTTTVTHVALERILLEYEFYAESENQIPQGPARRRKRSITSHREHRQTNEAKRQRRAGPGGQGGRRRP